MSKIYQSLVKERVHIPSAEAVAQSLCPDYYAESQNNTYNPSSTAPQSLNQSIATVQQTPSSRSSIVSATPQSTKNQFSTHQQLPNVTPLVNPADLAKKGETPKLSREQQVEIANKIKGEYKKLNEY